MGAVIAAELEMVTLHFQTQDQWHLTAETLTWVTRGQFNGPEKYIARMETSFGHLCGTVVVVGDHVKGMSALWSEETEQTKA